MKYNKGILIQYAAGICGTLTLIFHGITLGWPSPVFPKFISGDTGIDISQEQMSWAASLPALSTIPGCFMAQYLGDKAGRRATILLLALPAVLGSVMLLFAKSAILICIARFICGIPNAMAITIVSMYVGEIADRKIRGQLGAMMTTMASIGNLFVYAAGPYLTYYTLNWMCLAVPVLAFVSSYWIPESPYYYFIKRDFTAATRSLSKLKQTDPDHPDVQIELKKIGEHVNKDMSKKTSIFELLSKAEYRKSVTILTGLKFLQQMTGTLAIQSYMQIIFEQSGMKINAATGSLMYGVIQFFAGIFSTIMVDKMGRRPLLMISSFGTGVSLTMVGWYFLLKSRNSDIISEVWWMPMLGIIGFNVLYGIGIGNLPYVLQSEIFPTNVKSAASSIATIFGGVLAFFTAKFYTSATQAFGVYSVFWTFAFISYSGVAFIYFVIPETKGKTLQEIQALLSKRKDQLQVSKETELFPLQNKC